MEPSSETPIQQPTFGVYFLANDYVYDYTIAFLNSFRFHNPSIPLCLIPFDENIERLEPLSSTYKFTIFTDKKSLLRCDGISAIMWRWVMGHFRKLAMWDGIFDCFIYIDIDTIVLRPLDYMFSYLEEFDFVTASSNIDDSRKFTWNDSMYNSGLLDKEQINYAANTGFIVSKKNLLTVDKAANVALEYAVALKPHMFASMEQPFLNFLIVTSKANYTSIHRLSTLTPSADIPLEIYAPDPNWTVSDEEATAYKGRNHAAFLIHWAGQTQPRMSRFPQAVLAQINKVILYFMKLGIPHRKYHRKVWLRYRQMRENVE